jgi:hypothetical protein
MNMIFSDKVYRLLFLNKGDFMITCVDNRCDIFCEDLSITRIQVNQFQMSSYEGKLREHL